MSKKPKKEFNKLTPLCSAADNMTLLIEDLIEKLRTIVARENMGEGLDAKYIKELVAAMKDLTFVIRNLNDTSLVNAFFIEHKQKPHAGYNLDHNNGFICVFS